MKLTISKNTPEAKAALIASGFSGLKFPAELRFTNHSMYALSVACMGCKLPSMVAKDNASKTGLVPDLPALTAMVGDWRQLAQLRNSDRFLTVETVDEKAAADDEGEEGATEEGAEGDTSEAEASAEDNTASIEGDASEDQAEKAAPEGATTEGDAAEGDEAESEAEVTADGESAETAAPKKRGRPRKATSK